MKTIMIACIMIIIGGSLLFAFYRINTFQSYLDTFRDNYFQTQKNQVYKIVQDRISDIAYYETTIETVLKDEITIRIDEAISIGENLYEEIEDKEDFQAAYVETLRDIRFSNGNGYYFIVDFDGNVLLQADNQGLEGQNILSLQNTDGKYVVKDLIDIASSNGSGFYEYKWTKPGVEGNDYDKIAYVRYFEPLHAFVGTGLYYDDVNNVVKKDIYDRFKNYTYDEEGYLFVVNYDSIAQVFADPDLIGKSINSIVDADGTPLHSLFMAAIANPTNGGFVEYEYWKPGQTIKANKVSYIEAYPPWNVYIGTGFYMDDFEAAVLKDRKMAFNQLVFELVIFAVMIIGLSILVGMFIYRILRQTEKAVNDEEMIYETLSELSAEGMIVLRKSGLIEEYNQKAKDLFNLDDEVVEEISNYLDVDYNRLEEKISGQIQKGDEIIPIEWYLKTIHYNSETYYVLYIGDMSSRIDYERKLELMATTDMLTGLHNRRYFMENYHHEMAIINRYKKPICLAMLDIDFFKGINDKHGHATGDHVLQDFSAILKNTFRESDLVARYGGEEFMVLMTDTALDQARVILLRFKRAIMEHPFENGIELTFSAGLLEINTDIINANTEIHLNEVDELLYRAKTNGRNRIEIPYR